MAEVVVQPTDLSFRFQLNRQLLATITISNPHDSRLAYKIKTTAPKKYVVRPSSGTADPKGTVSIQVIMQAQKEYPSDFQNCKDKFMVQTAKLAEGEFLCDTTFSKESGREIKEARLRVVLDGPAVPSPVKEDPDATTEAALKRTMNDLAVANSETTTMKAKIESLSKECETLRRTLDAMELQGASKSNGAVATADKFILSYLHLAVAVVVAFLVGMYLK